MEKFSVGQVVFLFLRQEQQVVPALIVEEVVRKRLNGQEIKYFVKVSPDSNSKSFQLDVEKEQVFIRLEDARTFMMNNAQTAINEICEEAKIAAMKFGVKDKTPVVEDEQSVETISTYADLDVQKIRLPNGEIVNVRSN